ncbi:efflux RND transporter periplasmic adaptor subunit [Desulfovibrio aminophilus]|uniref:efflux RND transporter periplasmic adaptor subunit n=1 Tax=Desulfovibrio aminophilus TaxID=81425 RepID=UPI000404388D|nr:efflux RND transporter periplasmic adaptor subunit [Desulfovibrio aminophilus]
MITLLLLTRPLHPARLLFRLLLPLTLSSLLLLPGCGGKEEKGKKPVPVSTATAEKRTMPVELKAVGSVEAYASVAIKTRLGGQILEQFVRDGQDVRQGDPLFRIDPRPYEAAVREARAKLERDQALLKKAADDLRRYSGLIEKNVISREQYEQTEANAKSLAATIRLNQAELESRELDLSYTLISSPIDGRVGHILVTQGNVIKANDDRDLAVINQIRPIYVTFAVPEQHVTAILQRMHEGTLPVEAYSSSDGSFLESGALASLDNAVDKTTGTIKLKAVFSNEKILLWPGQFVRVTLSLSSREGVVVVPSRAVQAGNKGQYVYVVTAQNAAELRPVKVGTIMDGLTIIDSGLEGGETVVTEGQIRLVPGAPVQAAKGAAAPAGAEGAKP